MPVPLTVRHNREPDECDKLSSDEIDALVLEVMKTYQDPEVTKNPYMSPLLAPADLLTGLPTAHNIIIVSIISNCLYYIKCMCTFTTVLLG